MKIDKDISRVLAHTAYVTNIFNGGMTMPSTKLDRLHDHYLLQVEVPGVDLELLSVEIHKNGLFVFQAMDMIDAGPIPHVINHLNIPSDVDFHGIRAEFHGRKLKVVMPFNELADGQNRDIEIVKY